MKYWNEDGKCATYAATLHQHLAFDGFSNALCQLLTV